MPATRPPDGASREFLLLAAVFQRAWPGVQAIDWIDSTGVVRDVVPPGDAVLAKHSDTFPKVTLFTVDELFGGWAAAQKEHFSEGGVFDQIYTAGDKK